MRKRRCCRHMPKMKFNELASVAKIEVYFRMLTMTDIFAHCVCHGLKLALTEGAKFLFIKYLQSFGRGKEVIYYTYRVKCEHRVKGILILTLSLISVECSLKVESISQSLYLHNVTSYLKVFRIIQQQQQIFVSIDTFFLPAREKIFVWR